MDATELMAAMRTVEQDHVFVLEQMQGLKEAVGHLTNASVADRQAVDSLTQYYKYFATQFAAHMAEEEETLFVLLKKHGKDGDQQVTRLLQAHDEIHNRLDNLERCLHVAGELDDFVPRQVLYDLFAFGWELWHVLDEHARQETAAMHACMMESLLAEGAAPDLK